MTEKKRTSSRLRNAARERMKATGEKYTTALQAVMDAGPLTTTAPATDPGQDPTVSAHSQPTSADAGDQGLAQR